jgi:hypothetical protein
MPLTDNIKKTIELTLPLKIILASVLTAIAGPGFLAFSAEYATYHYALSAGVRPPVEGVPFLAATVALGSILLAIMATGLFLLFRYGLKLVLGMYLYMVNEFAQTIDQVTEVLPNDFGENVKSFRLRETVSSIPKLKAKKAFIIISVMAIAIGILLEALHFISLSSSDSIAFHSAIMTWLALLTVWRPVILWFVGVVAVGVFYLSILYLMFSGNNYEEFLREVKFGGSIPITIEYNDENNTKEKYNLIIRTSTVLLVKNKHDNIKEIFLENIRSVGY